MKVYLCGGINGLSDADCKDWRDASKKAFNSAGIEFLDPMRRDYRGKELESVNEIVMGDLEDIEQCDCILVNASRASWGTAMEVALASTMDHNPLIFGFGAGQQPSPWLVFHCTHLFDNLPEAINCIITLAKERK